MNINNFWNNIKNHEGETFHTVTNLEFTYQLVSEYAIKTSRTDYNLSIWNFEKALELNPSKPGDISKAVRGSSYVYALITDERMQ